MLVVLWSLAASGALAQEPHGRLRVIVTTEGQPVAGVSIVAGGQSAETGAEGVAELDVAPGVTTVLAAKAGFFEGRAEAPVAADQVTVVEIALTARIAVDEEVVVVASTRTGRRLEDQPTRVEVIGREEIEEKLLMTPGDIVMMLNEMGGLRVQATSPSIGAASVRVQGMRGRYTRVLSDGLPLFGQQVGGLGLLQIPPMDLGQVEVIKGVASAFYGAGAMGGVVNLLSRRPGREPTYDALLNASTLGATDAVVYASTAARDGWSASVLAGGHGQRRTDRDDDGWADLAGYRRVIVRPRAFWDGGNGRSAFLTAGLTWEERHGGTVDAAVLPSTGEPYREALDTLRSDVGGTIQTLLANRFVLTARGAANWQGHTHTFGPVVERDRHANLFGEVAVRGSAGPATWVAGLAYERDAYRPRDVPRFAYTFDVPGAFAQADVQATPWLALSAGARVDVHSEYGTFLSPRVSALVRQGAWTSRASVGQGFFAATPLTEETEAAGLTRLTIPRPLEAERGTSASLDLTRSFGATAVTATVFGSRIVDPLQVERASSYALSNQTADATNAGFELLGTWRQGPLAATATYTYVRSREGRQDVREDAELTPRHSAGLVGMWEAEQIGRIGLEVYYTGRQRLEVNPHRTESRPYVIVGLLAERRLGRARLFLNAENLTGVRQTRWDPLLRPSQGPDGRWTVDAWAPLDGRVLNGGLRFEF
ncbi:MAG: TonB-dependent receptor plug domain-containing protein [Vicinamibacterales bacterium]